ncbi:MAG: DNA polymerase IV [Candidatus Micrarchaeaceae archaeon]|jgi:nucleotidyltransferase/DNA polymerase involved in DNA repair
MVASKLVLFIDMDYFFAACEELRHPEFKSKALVVGTSPISKKEKGVVQTCNYEARKFGIHSAMPTMQALKLNPDIVYLESDDAYYSEISSRVMKLLKDYGFNTEVISIDEAALELNDLDYKNSEKIGIEIKEKIKKEIGLPCTIGISIGKVYAKMICDESKPNGLGILRDNKLKEFLKDKSMDKLLGVGRKTSDKLKQMKINTIGELGKADPNVLVEKFGEFGKELFLLANGIDNSRVIASYSILSIGRERTFDKDTKDFGEIENMADKLCKEVMTELNKNNMWFRGISVKAKYSDFSEHIKNKKLNNYTDSFDLLYNTSMQLIKELVKDKNLRKIGVRTYELEAKKGQRRLS